MEIEYEYKFEEKHRAQSAVTMANAAIVQEEFGREDSLKLVKKRIPDAGPGQVVVRVKLRNVHIFDFVILRGLGVAGGTPGCEGYGIVHEVGEGVTKVRRGQRVAPFITVASTKGNGAWQEYVCLDEEFVWPLPDAITDVQAAQFVVNPWTAYSMMEDLGAVPKGEYVVQTAAGSTVGRLIVSLAKRSGIGLISVVRRAEQKAELEALGVGPVICSAEEDVAARVMEITGGRRAWAALDAVAGSMTETLASCVRDGGQIFVYGALSSPTASAKLTDLWRGVQLIGWTLFRVFLDREKSAACAAAVSALMTEGVLQTPDAEIFDLADFKKALTLAEQAGSSRKVMLASA